MFHTTGPSTRHCPPCGHYTHVGTCPDCQRRQLERAKQHIVQSTLAYQRWCAEQEVAK